MDTYPIKIQSLGDIQLLIKDAIQESLHIDYKDSRALTRKNRDEIVKDVSAFANADGGVLVYGVEEQEHLPARIDGGVDNGEMNREWIEQILNTNITPKLTGIEIVQIPCSATRSIYVLHVAKSYRGPHQASDKKYYKRFNFSSCPMDHYEISDVAGRRNRVPPLIMLDVEIVRFMVRLTVENISDHAVTNVSFKFPEAFRWPSEPELPWALKQGIRYFPPGRKFSYFYDSSVSVFDKEKRAQTEFEVQVCYLHPELGREMHETFYINLYDYYGTALEADENGRLTKSVQDGFRAVKEGLGRIERVLKGK